MSIMTLRFLLWCRLNSTFLTGLSFPSYGLLSTVGDTLPLDLLILRGKYILFRHW